MKIPYKDLWMYAYSSDKLVQSEIQGIVLNFTGLGGASMIKEDPELALSLAKEKIVYLHPYINPWAWMNKAAVALTDASLDALFEEYNLPDEMPIISQGGSMGGLCALTYAAYAKRMPAGVAANCPVCDLPYHYTERPDLPRTLLSAFGDYDMPLQEAMETASPYHLALKGMLPDIRYYIVHCEADKAVNKGRHSDRLVDVLGLVREVEYHTVPERGHCDLSSEAKEDYIDFMKTCCKERWS